MTQNKMQEIKQFLANNLEKVEHIIEDALRSDVAILDRTNRSLREHPGKMLRPMLAILAAGAAQTTGAAQTAQTTGATQPMQTAGTANDDTLQYAAATELLHNATLLHDDVVDGATLRRGLPTVASLLGGPAAVLIGDFWLVKAIKAILDASRYSEDVIRLFAATLQNLAEGELLQMEKASSADTAREDYERIIYCKTACLFETAAASAVISVGAPKEQADALKNYARILGLAFQMKDDIMDYGESSIGKPTGIDLKEQKITLPLLCAMETAPEEAQSIREKVAKIADHPELADEVKAFVTSNNGVQRAEAVLDQYISEAKRQLEKLAPSTEKDYLAQLAQYVGAREY